MKINIVFCFTLVLLALVVPNVAAESQAYNFWRDGGHWYTIKLSPERWSYNPDFARRAGVDSFFTVAGYGINDSPAALSSIVTEKAHPESTLLDHVEWERTVTIDRNPNIEYSELDWVIENVHGHDIELRLISAPGSPLLQYAAYIDSGENYFVALFMQIYGDTDYFNSEFADILQAIRLQPYSLRIEQESGR